MSIEDQLQQLSGDFPHGLTEGVALGTGLAEGYDFYESAIGEVIVTFNPDGVSSVDIADGFEDRYRERFSRGAIRLGTTHLGGDRAGLAGEAARRSQVGHRLPGARASHDGDDPEGRGTAIRLGGLRGREPSSCASRRVGGGA